MRVAARRLSPAKVDDASFAKFLHILARCGVPLDGNGPSARGDQRVLYGNKEKLLSDRDMQSFLPLFTPYFDFHNQQLTTLGDTVIRDYLSDVTLSYCAQPGLVLTTNTAKQLEAVFHNHFTMQLFASELGFAELAMPLASPDQHTDAGLAASLGFLTAHSSGVTDRDLAGTSFQMTPLSSGQSPLGWKMSHFVGAVYRAFGPSAARTCVDKLYDIEATRSLPECAAKLLLRILDHFPAANVAEALLAAQGLPLCFVGKARTLPDAAGEEESGGGTSHDNDGPGEGRRGQPSSSDTAPSSSRMAEDDLLVLRGFGSRGDWEQEGGSVTASLLDSVSGEVSPEAMKDLLASGPGLVDYTARWQSRTAALVAQQAEPSPAESVDSGWLTPAEQRRFRGGPAFAHTVDFSLHESFADTYGVPAPTDGKIVSRRKFKKPVLDPLFYDKLSDRRNGVPLDTEGEPLHAYLEIFTRPQRRLFEVTMLTPNSRGRVMGRAVATRYTVARDSACKAYLGGVLNDLQRLSTQHHDSEVHP